MGIGASANILNTAYQKTTGPCSSFNAENLAKSGALGLMGGAIGYGGSAIGNKLYWPSAVIGREVGETSPILLGPHGAAIGVSVGGYVANQ